MKRSSLMWPVLVLLLAGSTAASSIDYLSNRSASYLRNFARNAATEGTDLVTYNPAGLVFLEEGFHLGFGNQFLLKDYTIEVVPYWAADTTVTYRSTEPTLFFPDLYAVYRTGDWAAFGAFTVPAGGGSLDYTEGIYAMPLLETGLQQMLHPGASICFAVMDEGFIRAGSQYLAGTAGVSYALSDVLSVGLAGRYTSASRTYEGAGEFTVTWVDTTAHQIQVSRVLDVEKSASGMNVILSVDLMPAAGLNVAMRYETRTSLEFETTVHENSWAAFGLPDSSFTDGYLQHRDLPAVFAGGVQYQLSPELRLGALWNYYLVEDAAEDSLDGLDDDYEDGWDLGMGLDYQVCPKTLLGLGYLYSNLGGSEETFSDFEYNLDYHSLGAGARRSITDDLALTLAGGRNFYLEGTGAGPYEDCTYDKQVWFFGLGAEITLR